jgi:ABC-type methionine transport system ATPase subunit
MQKSVKVRLQFNTSDTEKPFVHLFATKFGLVFSILQADIMPGRGGRMIMDLTGEAEDIERALAYATERNVWVKILSKAIVWNDAASVHCGACTGRLPP